MSQPAGILKVCSVCGKYLWEQQTIRDQQGRCYCQPCWQRRKTPQRHATGAFPPPAAGRMGTGNLPIPPSPATLLASLSTFELGHGAAPGANAAPAPRASVPAALPQTGTHYDQAMAELDADDANRRLRGLVALARLTPQAPHRPAVIAKVLPWVDDSRTVVQIAAAKCVRAWMDASSEPALLAQLAKASLEGRRTLLPLVASLKTETAATAVAQRLSDPQDRPTAVRELIGMGSVAEAPVRTSLTTSTDRSARLAACQVLMTIGTPASLPLLDSLDADADPAVRGIAKVAAEKIRRRNR